MKRTLWIIAGLAILGSVMWWNAPRPLGRYSAWSNGKSDISLGPFVNTTPKNPDCISDGWTRSCYDNIEELKSVTTGLESEFNSHSCANPAELIGERGNVRLVDRGTLMEPATIWPSSKVLRIDTGSCMVNVYNMNDPYNSRLLMTLKPHSTRDLTLFSQRLGFLQK